MTGYEILEVVQQYCNGDEKDTIVEMNELIGDIQKDANGFIKGLNNVTNEFALGSYKCPLCGEDLESSTHYEDKEYQGQIVKESVTTTQCSDCYCSYIMEA